jgi:hypothetical protein
MALAMTAESRKDARMTIFVTAGVTLSVTTAAQSSIVIVQVKPVFSVKQATRTL